MGFNKKQLEAIHTIHGPVMVISCPGSGKTTVVVDRAKEIVESGVDGNRVLVITFTKASADEMKERFEKKYGDMGIHFATIHSVCLMMLKQAYGFGVDKLISASEQYQIMTDWLKDEDVRDLDTVIPAIYTGISYCNNRLMDPLEYEPDDANFVGKKLFKTLYDNYMEYKTQKGLFDFDDILTMAKELLEARPDWLEYYQNYFQYLMIDEYQDTNQVQADIFYMIADRHRNICVVGDDDQSIYGFRAADSRIMMNFKKRFPECKEIYMDVNYRSCPEIISHADALIQNNQIRFKKNFQVGRSAQDKGSVTYLPVDYSKYNDIEENILDEIKKIIQQGENMEKYAILYRTHAEVSLLVNMLISNKIPFKAADRIPDIHDSIIYQDILSFYRLANHKAQKYDFSKVLNKPNKFFKRNDYNEIMGIAGSFRREIFDIIDQIESDWQRRQARAKMKEYLENLSMLEGKQPKEFFIILEKLIGYDTWMKDFCEYANKSFDEMRTLYETLKKEALKHSSMQEWFDSVHTQKMILLEQKRNKNKKDGKAVTLSTFHSSKGLEWENIYIISANEGKSPSKKAKTADDIEEERRLFYVAMTRAKENLTIMYEPNDPSKKIFVSRFVKESKRGNPVIYAENSDFEEAALINKIVNENAVKEVPKTEIAAMIKPENLATKTGHPVDDMVIPFGPAAHYKICDISRPVLIWYINNIPDTSKYAPYKKQILDYLA